MAKECKHQWGVMDWGKLRTVLVCAKCGMVVD